LSKVRQDQRPNAEWVGEIICRIGRAAGIIVHPGDEHTGRPKKFVSAHDLRGQESQVAEWVQRVPLAVVTAGAAGALLYVNGDRFEVRPRRTREVDATGAGDVFAATFLVHYDRHGDPWDAAEAATCAASLSVEGEGWSAVPDPPTLAAALDAYRASSR